MSKPDLQKINALRQALDDYQNGASPAGNWDQELEAKKAKVRSRALLLLEQRARSRQELSSRLVKAGFESYLAEVVVEDLARVGLVNDAAFAAEWVRQRHNLKGKSAAWLDRELRDKGISADTRAQALAQVSEESEQEIAWRLALKKAQTVKEIPQDRQEYNKNLRRVVGVIARRGFNPGLAFSLASKALEERCAELEHTS